MIFSNPKFKLLFVLAFVVSVIQVSAQTKLYLNPKAEIYAQETKSIAILPLKVQINLRPREQREITPEQMIEMRKNESLDVQKAMHTWFLKRKEKGQLRAELQSVDKTNSILKKEGYDIHNLDELSPKKLGEILGVDCVIKGSLETSKPMSGAVALGMQVLLGFGGATSEATCNIDFYNTADEALVVNYYKTVRGGLGSSSIVLVDVLMRKVTRRIPYTSKK